MQENTLKGLWIPYEILTSEQLSDKEKYIYSLILFFSKNDGYCTITNKFLASIVNLSDIRVSKLVSSLSKKKYSRTTTYIDNNNNSTSQKYTNAVANNDKYINNKKHNNRNNERVYTPEFLENIYANKF